MELQQLKALAANVRSMLEQSGHPIGHSQSLDLIAALPGLRNWPEVIAFPERVRACDTDAVSLGRLAFRVNKATSKSITTDHLLASLATATTSKTYTRLPELWPTGPAPGVYLTSSNDAINALLAAYEDATDGALVYAERAGSHWDGSINLGEHGLYSAGLTRVPSGTLLILGPIEFDQQNLEDAAQRIEMACMLAKRPGHRVAVLVDSPTPHRLCEDALLMVKSRAQEGDDHLDMIAGEVSEAGDMLVDRSFLRSEVAPKDVPSPLDATTILEPALSMLREALRRRTTGLVTVGSPLNDDHPAIELAVDVLALTRDLGPAARVQVRHRSTPAKDWQVPDAIKALPYLSSVQSAIAQGYRRIVIDARYIDDALATHGLDALFIGHTFGSDIESLLLNSGRTTLGRAGENQMLLNTIALLGIATVGGHTLTDMAFPDMTGLPVENRLERLLDVISAQRVLKTEDQVRDLLHAGRVTLKELTELSDLHPRSPLREMLKRAQLLPPDPDE